MEAFKGGPPGIPGSPRPAEPNENPGLCKLPFNSGIVWEMIRFLGTSGRGRGSCGWPMSGFCAGWFCGIPITVISCAEPGPTTLPLNVPKAIAKVIGSFMIGCMSRQSTVQSPRRRMESITYIDYIRCFVRVNIREHDYMLTWIRRGARPTPSGKTKAPSPRDRDKLSLTS